MPTNNMNQQRARTIGGGILAWALNHGIYQPDVYSQSALESGDPSLSPFDSQQAEYFKTRKIINITVEKEGRVWLVKVFARLLPAQKKLHDIKRVFQERYSDERIELEVTAYRTFKIDQNIEPTVNPIYRSPNGNIACGSSVGLGNQRNAGTLTAIGRDKNGVMIGISCNHVVGGCNTAREGTPIVVPGIQDVTPEHPVSTLIGKHDFCGPMTQGLPSKYLNISNNCDIGIFQLEEESIVSTWQGHEADGYDTPTQYAKIKKGLTVKKWGRSSGLTHGKIVSVAKEPQSLEYNVVSYYSPTASQVFKGRVYYDNVIEVASVTVNGFSTGGDSGALVVTDVNGEPEEIVGILIGGGKNESFILPLQKIMAEFGIALITNIDPSIA